MKANLLNVMQHHESHCNKDPTVLVDELWLTQLCFWSVLWCFVFLLCNCNLAMAVINTDPAAPVSAAVVVGDEEMTDVEKRERLLQTYNALCDESFKGVPEISSEEVLRILSHPSEDVRTSIVLVDCRSEAEQAVSMIPGAVTMIEVEENLDKYKDVELIPYCAIGRRSGCLTKRLLERNPGMKIRNHMGGILDWSHVEGPLVDRSTQQAIQRLHAGGAYHLKHLPSFNKKLEILLPNNIQA